jgi:hypothetical protein
LNDKEPIAAAAGIASAGNRFKSDLGKAKSVAKADRDAAKRDVDVMVKQANTVKGRISDGKPAAADVRLLGEHVAKLQAFVASHEIATTNWPMVQASHVSLQKAFGLAK